MTKNGSFYHRMQFFRRSGSVRLRIPPEINILKPGIKMLIKYYRKLLNKIKFYLMNKKHIYRRNALTKKRGSVELPDILLELFLELTGKEKEILRAKIENARFIQCSDRHGKIKLEYCDTNYALHTILITPS
jgi:hypothetical protein